jgi:hypothetical protein
MEISEVDLVIGGKIWARLKRSQRQLWVRQQVEGIFKPREAKDEKRIFLLLCRNSLKVPPIQVTLKTGL